MQSWLPDGTRQERTGWRDGAISSRHRDWGFNCPAVDLDFLVVEYNLGLPVAMIEYKHHRARKPDFLHPTYRALSELANGYRDPLPFMVTFYWPEVWAFRVHPVNGTARECFEQAEDLSEYDFVSRLYRLRRLTLTRELENKLNRELPPVEAA